MTINEAIERLKQLQTRWGDIAVYFDCPTCGKSFSPDTAVPKVGVHIEGKQTK